MVGCSKGKKWRHGNTSALSGRRFEVGNHLHRRSHELHGSLIPKSIVSPEPPTTPYTPQRKSDPADIRTMIAVSSAHDDWTSSSNHTCASPTSFWNGKSSSNKSGISPWNASSSGRLLRGRLRSWISPTRADKLLPCLWIRFFDDVMMRCITSVNVCDGSSWWDWLMTCGFGCGTDRTSMGYFWLLYHGFVI